MKVETIPTDEPPALVETALESLLNQSMLRIRVIAELDRCGSWFIDEPRYHSGLFHLVGAGQCKVESAVLEYALHLDEGDLVLFPQGDAHRLSAIGDTARTPTGTAASTSFICGEMQFFGHTQHPLNQALPACFVVRAKEAGETFRQLTAIMITVIDRGQTGRQVLLNKLADALFTLAICDYARRADNRRGLFAAVGEPRISRVLHAIHEKPGNAWAMQSMAELACMSRSAFAERFTHLLEMPPMAYVTQWRVGVAEQLLRDRKQSVAGIAEALGYSSEAAFRRLFKRVSGLCPGQIRAGTNAISTN